MAGPSGVDAPAPDAPQMVDDAFRVFSALSQGDLNRAESIVVQMGDGEFGRLRSLAATLERVTRREAEARQRGEVLPPVDPESEERWARANAEGRAR